MKNKISQNIKKTDDPLNDEFEQIFDDLIISKLQNNISEMEKKILDKLTEVNNTNTEVGKNTVNSIKTYIPDAKKIAKELAENDDFIEQLSNKLEDSIDSVLKEQLEPLKSPKHQKTLIPKVILTFCCVNFVCTLSILILYLLHNFPLL